MAAPEPPEASGTRAGRTWLGAAGVLVVAGSLLWTAGLAGVVVGGLLAILWYLLPAAYVVAIGHVGLLAVVPAPGLGLLVALEAGFVGILTGPFAQPRTWWAWPTSLPVLALGLGAIGWLGWSTWNPHWLAPLAIVTLVAVGVYGLHRYSVVVLARNEVTRAG